MTTALEPELSTFRWSSNDPADRFPVEDPATGEVITLVQGGGAAQVDAAVEAAHRAFDDADFDRAVKDAAEGGFYNKGEACTVTSRILVRDGIYDRFVGQLAAAVKKLKVGRGTNPAVHVGPVVSRHSATRTKRSRSPTRASTA